MASSFHINFPGTPTQFVVNANKTIQSNGGVFDGDHKIGSFSIQTAIGGIKGNYKVLETLPDGKTLVEVNILQKPLLVPTSTIQKVIEGFF